MDGPIVELGTFQNLKRLFGPLMLCMKSFDFQVKLFLLSAIAFGSALLQLVNFEFHIGQAVLNLLYI